jgi:hypothetical protein
MKSLADRITKSKPLFICGDLCYEWGKEAAFETGMESSARYSPRTCLIGIVQYNVFARPSLGKSSDLSYCTKAPKVWTQTISTTFSQA